jgi:hypothetical protein
MKLPILSAVMLAGVVETAEAANAIVTGWSTVKPEPLTVTEDPMVPLDGVRVIDGITVKLE